MWLETLRWPWWVRWTTASVALSLFAAAVAAGLEPRWETWLVVVTACVVGVVVAGLTTLAQQWGRRPYVDALGDLDSAGVTAVVRTLAGTSTASSFTAAALLKFANGHPWIGVLYVALVGYWVVHFVVVRRQNDGVRRWLQGSSPTAAGEARPKLQPRGPRNR